MLIKISNAFRVECGWNMCMLRGLTTNCEREKIMILSKLLNCSAERVKGALMPKSVKGTVASKILQKTELELETSACYFSRRLTTEDILRHPKILAYQSKLPQRHYEILQEIGITHITAQMLMQRFNKLMNKSLRDLCGDGEIVDIDQPISEMSGALEWPQLTTKLPSDYGEIKIQKLRQLILSEFLSYKLKMDIDHVTRNLNRYSTIKNRPLKSIKSILNVLIKDVGFSTESLSKNLFLFRGQAEVMQKVLRLPTIGATPTLQLALKFPRILESNADDIIEIESILKRFDLSCAQMSNRNVFYVYCLSPETVRKRLEFISDSRELSINVTSDRYLRLVAHFDKAKNRLDTLKKSGFDNNATVDILTSHIRRPAIKN